MKKLLFALCLSCANPTVRADAASELTKTLTALQKKSSLPGFAVAVVTPGGELYEHGFGLADIARKTPYSAHTLQNLGSVSKTVVGVALAKAIELGYFELDTDINTILPFAVAHPAGKPITIRHLATHTSGIVDDEEVYGHSYYLTPYADRKSPLYRSFERDSTVPKRGDLALGSFLRDYLSAKGRYFKRSNFASAAPGKAYEYSNIGAALAAYLVEIKSGVSFDAFTQTHIFKPLGMRETSWVVTPATAARVARTYNTRHQAYPHYGLITYPDGGLTSSAADMGRYLGAMLRGFMGEAGVLTSAGYRQLFEQQFTVDALPAGSPKGEPNSGIFWRIKPDGQVGHTGSDPGITAFLFFNPVKNSGKFLMTNIEFAGAGGDDDPKVVEQFRAVWKALDTLATPFADGPVAAGEAVP